jgi:hypothetical protein
MEYNDMLNPYTDFLNYVGHFDSVSDGCVTPALRTISTASRTIGSVSAFAGSMLKYGARALGKHGRSFQMIARPEAGLLGDGNFLPSSDVQMKILHVVNLTKC